jgi:hypothetical protein
MASRELKLGGQTYTLTVPLTLGQLIEANVGMSLAVSTDPQEEVRRSYKRAVDVLVAALKPEHPDVTAESLMAIRGVTLADFNGAARAALEESGLIARADAQPEGEATAGE